MTEMIMINKLNEWMQFIGVDNIYDMVKPIYHYTSINTLALILKNKSLRLNSLSNVDDTVEGNTEDIGNIKKYIFVSCWTDQKEESIPLWKQYTPNMKGVRIGLAKYPFEINKIEYKPKHLILKPDWSFFTEDIIVNDEFVVFPKNNLLEKVEYTDDELLLTPKILNIEENSYSIAFGNIGKYKRSHWKYQSEIRYIARVIPGGGVKKHDIPNWNLGVSLYNAIINKSDISKQSLFLKLRDDAFEQMEVLLGPNSDLSDEIIVSTLLEKYNPKVRHEKSCLTGKIQ